MGYIRHQAVVAVLNNHREGKDAIAAVEALRREMDDADGPPNCIVGPVVGVNGYVSYAFLPDGSKEGWQASDVADLFRERFIAAAKIYQWADIVHIQLGGDDGETRVMFTTDDSVKMPAPAASDDEDIKF